MDDVQEWSPRYLAPEQVTDLYAQALAQAEAQVANAWINWRLAPQDPVREAAYRQAAAQLRTLEADLARLARSPAAGESEGAGLGQLPFPADGVRANAVSPVETGRE